MTRLSERLEARPVAKLVLVRGAANQSLFAKFGAAVVAGSGLCTGPIHPRGPAALRRHSLEILFAVWLVHALVVMRVMLSAFHHLKVFGAVVVLYAVAMVHDFIFRNRSSQRLRHHIDVLSNVAALVRVGMLGHSDQHIPVATPCATAVVARVSCSTPRVYRSSHAGILSEVAA